MKFRLWDKVNKRMYYENDVDNHNNDQNPSLLTVGLNGLPIAIDKSSIGDNEIAGWNVDHLYILMESSGIFDCDKNEIFVSDIVKILDNNIVGEIYFVNAKFVIKDKNNKLRMLDNHVKYKILNNKYEAREFTKELINNY